MSEPSLPLWNKDNSDVLPTFQLTFGHALLRGFRGDWKSALFRCLDLGSTYRSGPLQPAAIPRHARENCSVFGSTSELHLVLARFGDVWSVFGPHDLFFTSKKWMQFNAKVGGLLSISTQMDKDVFSYLVFERGLKQTNALVELENIRVFPDTPITAYIGDEKIFEDKSQCSLSEPEVLDFLGHDLAIRVNFDQWSIRPRFSNRTGPVEDITHLIFQRPTQRRSFLGIRLR